MDSQGLISGFHSFVTEAHLLPFRCLLQMRFYQEWALLQQIVSCWPAPVELIKVKAHAGNFGNDLADHIAKQGAVNGRVWAPSFSDLPDVCFHPVHGDDCPIEGDL
jgi:ribonuclease HI